MIDDTLERLQQINPVTGATAPPIEQVLRRIEAEERAATPARPRRRPLGGGLHNVMPVLGVAIAVAVAVVAVLALGHRARPRPAVSATPAHHLVPTPAPIVHLPRGGMPGVVQLWGAAASSDGATMISFEQCNPCHAPTAQRFREWMATSAGSNTGWTVEGEPFYLLQAQFAGRGVIWGDGQGRGSTINGIWVSHDDGINWSRVAIGPTDAPGNVSVASGEVWAAVQNCAPGCITHILHGPAIGAHLQPTPVQPLAGNVQVVAAGPGTAYLAVTGASSPGRFTRPALLASHDDGHSWRSVTSPCPFRTADDSLAAAGSGALWEQCANLRGRTVVSVSIDGGHRWHTHVVGFPLHSLQPTGPTTAWAVSDRTGSIVRTTDGGVSWSPRLATRGEASLLAASSSSATVVQVAARGHVDHHAANSNLIVSRTADGGSSWRSEVVALPAR